MQFSDNEYENIEFVNDIKFERDRAYVEWNDVLRRSNSSFDDVEQVYWNYCKSDMRLSAPAKEALKYMFDNYLWGARLLKELLLQTQVIDATYEDNSRYYFYELDKGLSADAADANRSKQLLDDLSDLLQPIDVSRPSSYAANSSLYYVDKIINTPKSKQREMHKQLFATMYRSMKDDFSRLGIGFGPSYARMNTDHQLISRLCLFLEQWFNERYNITKYGVKLDSCYTCWLDTLLIAFAVECVQSNAATRLANCTDFTTSVLTWAATGGHVQEGERPFAHDNGSGVPKSVAIYNMYTSSYDIRTNTIVQSNLTSAAITLAVYFEDIIKPVLFATSITTIPEEARIDDLYLHSIRNHSNEKLDIVVVATGEELKQDCMEFLKLS